MKLFTSITVILVVFTIFSALYWFNLENASTNSENLVQKIDEEKSEMFKEAPFLKENPKNDKKKIEIRGKETNSETRVHKGSGDDSHLEHLKNMRVSEYKTYSIEALEELAAQGDLVAFHTLAIKLAHAEQADLDKLKRLADKVYIHGDDPGVFLIVSDLVGSLTEDDLTALAYFYVAENLGDKLATNQRNDYLRRYKNTDKEKAIELSNFLIGKLKSIN